MIKIFFNEDGYYIIGEGVEIARRLRVALTEQGDPIFQTIHHTYKVCYLALKELIDLQIQDDVIVYNDSRIIEELSTGINSLDDTCAKWQNVILRYVVPNIKSVVFFRKRSMTEVQNVIREGHGKLLKTIDEKSIAKIMDHNKYNKNKIVLEKLRKNWFGEK